MVMESLLVEGSSTIRTLGSFDRSMFLALVIDKHRLVYGHKIAARMDWDLTVQPPSGDSRDLDYGHANGTVWVCQTGAPSRSCIIV